MFFVSLGGFDHHDGLLANHPALLTQVADAMTAFFEPRRAGRGRHEVTTFTASDFGRTLTTNGDGSDHGWGSLPLRDGRRGAGRRYYGSAPVLGDGGADDVGQGRLLPTMAVDQLAATLATWMGVAARELPMVVPGIGNFSVRDLGIFG